MHVSVKNLSVNPSLPQSLLRGTDSWSVAELAHALVVMSHFHSLSSFALGCGLTPEMDTSYEYLLPEGSGLSSLPGGPTNTALGVGRVRENSDSEPHSDSEPQTPEDRSPPTDSRTGQYMVQYYLDSTCK